MIVRNRTRGAGATTLVAKVNAELLRSRTSARIRCGWLGFGDAFDDGGRIVVGAHLRAFGFDRREAAPAVFSACARRFFCRWSTRRREIRRTTYSAQPRATIRAKALERFITHKLPSRTGIAQGSLDPASMDGDRRRGTDGTYLRGPRREPTSARIIRTEAPSSCDDTTRLFGVATVFTGWIKVAYCLGVQGNKGMKVTSWHEALALVVRNRGGGCRFRNEGRA